MSEEPSVDKKTIELSPEKESKLEKVSYIVRGLEAEEVSVNEVRKWLWKQLEESRKMENLGDDFNEKYGRKNIDVFATALESMRLEDLIGSYSAKEGEWHNYWYRK